MLDTLFMLTTRIGEEQSVIILPWFVPHETHFLRCSWRTKHIFSASAVRTTQNTFFQLPRFVPRKTHCPGNTSFNTYFNLSRGYNRLHYANSTKILFGNW